LPQEKESYDVVLTDLDMPLVGGLEVLRAAKERFPTIEVVIITGFASLESVIDSMRQGPFDYLTKPFNSRRSTSSSTRLRATKVA
jgi:DNA-binding NtrC family response regulator